jgi:hypothetical protein
MVVGVSTVRTVKPIVGVIAMTSPAARCCVCGRIQSALRWPSLSIQS